MTKATKTKVVGNILLLAIVVLILVLMNDYLMAYALEHPDGT